MKQNQSISSETTDQPTHSSVHQLSSGNIVHSFFLLSYISVSGLMALPETKTH